MYSVIKQIPMTVRLRLMYFGVSLENTEYLM